jgi:hypothetical protein
MKKSIFIAVLGVGMASAISSYGQGQVFFANYYSSTQTSGITYAAGSPGGIAGLGVGPEISVELFYGASTDTQFSQLTGLASSITPVGLGVATGPAAILTSATGAGWFSAGAVQIPLTGLNSYAAGTTLAFEIEAFGTYQSVAYQGLSGIYTSATQTSSSVAVPLLNSALDAPGANFTVAPVPEPTTLALAGLGGAALLALRRKKA